MNDNGVDMRMQLGMVNMEQDRKHVQLMVLERKSMVRERQMERLELVQQRLVRQMELRLVQRLV